MSTWDAFIGTVMAIMAILNLNLAIAGTPLLSMEALVINNAMFTVYPVIINLNRRTR